MLQQSLPDRRLDAAHSIPANATVPTMTEGRGFAPPPPSFPPCPSCTSNGPHMHGMQHKPRKEARVVHSIGNACLASGLTNSHHPPRSGRATQTRAAGAETDTTTTPGPIQLEREKEPQLLSSQSSPFSASLGQASLTNSPTPTRQQAPAQRMTQPRHVGSRYFGTAAAARHAFD